METQYLFPLKSDFASKNNLEKDLQIALRNFAKRLLLPSTISVAIANRLFILQEGAPAPRSSVVLFGHRKAEGWVGEPLRNKSLLSSFGKQGHLNSVLLCPPGATSVAVT